MSDHLTPDDFFEFIDRGGGSGPVGHHLMSCAECLLELDFLLLAEAPATPEEEAILDEIPKVTAEDLLERLRPRIASSGQLGFFRLYSPLGWSGCGRRTCSHVTCPDSSGGPSRFDIGIL